MRFTAWRFIWVLVIFQLVALGLYFKPADTLELRCASTFTRNAWKNYDFFYKGTFFVNLKKSGDGELTIRASSDDREPKQVVRTYAFRYRVDKKGQFYTNFIRETRGAADNVDDDFYRKYFFDLNFDSSGQIRVQRIKNTWLFLSPNLMISTCSPQE